MKSPLLFLVSVVSIVFLFLVIRKHIKQAKYLITELIIELITEFFICTGQPVSTMRMAH